VSGIMERVAGAPITWGVCEVGGWGVQLPPDRVLQEMADIGMRATELGPDGFLPEGPRALADLLARHGLRLVAGFHPVVLHLRDGLEERLEWTGRVADRLAAAGAEILVLAAAAADAGYETSPDLDDDQWDTLVSSIDRVADLAAERGLGVAVHPHQGTAIEREPEVRRLLATSSASLCLDTGHLLVGGTDPLPIVEESSDRIAHVHLKDVDATVAERVRSGRAGYQEAVRAGLYRPLGQGDLDVRGIVRALEGSGYRGWYVLEQDTVLKESPSEGEGPAHAASASMAFLRRVAAEEDGIPAGTAGRKWAAHGATSLSGEEV
jgi:inosose dehydratase